MKNLVLNFFFVCAMLFSISLGMGQEKTTLDLFTFSIPDNSIPSEDLKITLINNFMRDNPDIVINQIYVAKAEDYVPTVQKLFSENKAPDLFFTWGGKYLWDLAENGRLLDLTAESARLHFCEAAKEVMSFRGNLYAVAPLWTVAGYYINENKIKELGLSVPKTLDQLEKTADAFLSNGIQPFACGARDKWPLSHVYSYLVDRYSDNALIQSVTERKIRFDSEPFVLAAKKIQEWAAKGYFGKDPQSEKYYQAIDLMSNGKAGMHLTGTWMGATYMDKKKTDQSFLFIPFPVITGAQGDGKQVLGMADLAIAASAGAAKKKEAILRFFTYVLRADVLKENFYNTSSVPGAATVHPLVEMSNAVLQQADHLQAWWDQELPRELENQFYDAVYSFLDSATDVRAALAKMEDALAKKVGPVKK